MNKITLEKRTYDFMAYLNGDKNKWDCGKTPSEAIGNLIRTWPEEFSIVVEWPDFKTIKA